MMNTNEYAFLWDGSEPGWCVVDYGEGEPDETRYSIFNRETRQGLVIENEAAYQETVRRMLSNDRAVISAEELASLYR